MKHYGIFHVLTYEVFYFNTLIERRSNFEASIHHPYDFSYSISGAPILQWTILMLLIKFKEMVIKMIASKQIGEYELPIDLLKKQKIIPSFFKKQE